MHILDYGYKNFKHFGFVWDFDLLFHFSLFWEQTDVESNQNLIIRFFERVDTLSIAWVMIMHTMMNEKFFWKSFFLYDSSSEMELRDDQ